MNLFNIKRTFEMKKVKGWPEIYFCIDLHGTIIPSGVGSNDKTDKLAFYPDCREVLQWITARKDIMMILWTSTPVDRLEKVWEWLKVNDIQFDYINENPHAKNTPRSDFSRKFYFSVLLDDRASFTPETDWILVARELELCTGDKIIEWTDKNKCRLRESINNTVSGLDDLIIFK